ncbi:ribosome silencing factor [Serpentinicella alkaliphila]|uniref:Ribosomal silencing factor RsfS n=1 Tax=Serpentinicella alkaliphila TaxID=1734049 RepID=A0A4R2TXL8_9FIRM|nr:ribosome silencing factor [Serpentinicella alkaliphila]QUH26756.1 ribosome silencing factor [Serpentinicella alkaliphila]TCQ07976.1 ribosome-associated protein [Serpentinicella alkaliphila]
MLQNTEEMAYKIVKIIDNKLGDNIVMLDISSVSSIGDYFIITSAQSDRQTKAIADEIKHELSEFDIHPAHKEGYNVGRWVLLDYGDIVVHVFHEKDREFYNIEGIWKDAKTINIDKILENNI